MPKESRSKKSKLQKGPKPRSETAAAVFGLRYGG